MAAKLTFKYDGEADILHISKCAPYPEQESEELGDEWSPAPTPRLARSKMSRCCSSRLAFCALACLSCRLPRICG